MTTAETARRPDTADTADSMRAAHVTMSVHDAADALGCSAEYLYAGLRVGRFPGSKLGRVHSMPRAFVEGFIRDVLTVGRPISFEEYAARWMAAVDGHIEVPARH